jgi:hypothetical protein
VVERERARLVQRHPPRLTSVVPALRAAVESSDEKRNRRRGLSRIAVGTGIDSHETDAAGDEPGLLPELTRQSTLNGLSQLDEPSRKSPHSLERWATASYEKDSTRSERNGVDRQRRVRVPRGHWSGSPR